jgi:hypothetical protein
MDANRRKDRAKKLRERAADARAERARPTVEDAAWFLREKLLWPIEDRFDGLSPRGRIGALGGTAVATGAVVAALVLAIGGGSGSGSSAGTTEALVVRQAPAPAPAVKVAPAAQPKKKTAKPSGPTLHGAAPDFGPAKGTTAGPGGVEAGHAAADHAGASGNEPAAGSAATGEGPAARGSAATATAGTSGAAATADGGAQSGALASTAKIGATPKATASAEAQADSLQGKDAGVGIAEKGATGEAPLGPPAPKAAKRTARRFAEAFVVYEVGGVDSEVRAGFGRTTTKQLSRALLQRPPRQPAGVEVPQAKVVNVVAGPSREGVYPVSVSLLRVGVTSELRLELERGVGKKWQVTDVLG